MVTHGEEIYEKNNKSMKYELKLLLKKKKKFEKFYQFCDANEKANNKEMEEIGSYSDCL